MEKEFVGFGLEKMEELLKTLEENNVKLFSNDGNLMVEKQILDYEDLEYYLEMAFANKEILDFECVENSNKIVFKTSDGEDVSYIKLVALKTEPFNFTKD